METNCLRTIKIMPRKPQRNCRFMNSASERLENRRCFHEKVRDPDPKWNKFGAETLVRSLPLLHLRQCCSCSQAVAFGNVVEVSHSRYCCSGCWTEHCCSRLYSSRHSYDCLACLPFWSVYSVFTGLFSFSSQQILYCTVYSLDTAKTTSSSSNLLLSTFHLMYLCWKKQSLLNNRIKSYSYRKAAETS